MKGNGNIDIVLERVPLQLIPKSSVKKILVVKLDHIGDVIISIPAIKKLKEKFPDAELTMLVGSWVKELMESEPAIDRVLSYDFFPELSMKGGPGKPSLIKRKMLGDWLRSFNFDLAIDLRWSGAQETRFILKLCGAPYKVGFAAPPDDDWLTLKLPFRPTSARSSTHVTNQLLMLVDAIQTEAPGSLNINNTSIEKIEQLWKNLSIPISIPVVGLHIGAGNLLRQWLIENFLELGKNLSPYGTIIFLGGKKEKEYLENKKLSIPEGHIDLINKLSLEELKALLSKINLLIGNESGAAHLAASVGAATLQVWGGTTSHREWVAYGQKQYIVRALIPCAPCFIAKREFCNYNVDCLFLIKPEDVTRAAVSILNNQVATSPMILCSHHSSKKYISNLVRDTWDETYENFLRHTRKEGVKGKIKRFIFKFFNFFASYQEQINKSIYREIADLKKKIDQIEETIANKRDQK